MATHPTAAQALVWPLVLLPLGLSALLLRQPHVLVGAFIALCTYASVLAGANRDSFLVASLGKSSHDVRVTVATLELGLLSCANCLVLSLLPVSTVVWLVLVGVLAGGWLYCFCQHVRAVGLLAYASPATRTLLLRTSLLEWVQDTSFMKSVEKWKPFLVPMDPSETRTVLSVVDPAFRERLTRPGLVHDLPPGLQRVLLPSADARPLVVPDDALVAAPSAPATATTTPPSGTTATPPVDPNEIASALVQARVRRSLLAYCTAVPPSRVLTVAAGMSAVTWFALNRPRSRANAVASLRRAALTTAGSTAVALWVLFVVQYGVKRWASGHPLTALAAAAASGSGGRGGTQHHGSRTVALFSMLGRGVATIDRMRQWLGLHQQQIREHGPTAAMVLVITLALWSARRRL